MEAAFPLHSPQIKCTMSLILSGRLNYSDAYGLHIVFYLKSVSEGVIRKIESFFIPYRC